MTRLSTLCITTVVVLLTVAQQGFAIETVNLRSKKGALAGEVTGNSKTEITLKQPAKTEPLKIPANDVATIVWSGEPITLNINRSYENSGKLQMALDGYKKVLSDNKPTGGLKIDLEYAVARTTAKMALADASKLDEAIKLLEAFKSANPDNYNFYDTHTWLGRVYVAKKESAKAQAVFDVLAKAPWKDTQMQGRVAAGRLAMSEGKTSEAITAFDAVIAMKTDTPQESSQRFDAMLAKVKVLVTDKKHDEALKLITEVIEKASAEDARVQAEAFLRQGDAFQAQGKTRDAILAYLHVDLLYPGETTQHAEALFNLSRLCEKDGQPTRGAEARDRLKADYPNSQWAKMADSGT